MTGCLALAISFALTACASEVTGFGEDGDGAGGDVGSAGGSDAGGLGSGGSGLFNDGGSGAVGGEGSGGSGSICDPPQHACGGICADNTPETGCFESVDCAPCAAPPMFGVSTCSAAGACDFSCNAGYVKSGASCECAAACCTNADCGGGGAVCNGGVCETPSSCDDGLCFAGCIATGNLGGFCMGDTCTCIPAP